MLSSAAPGADWNGLLLQPASIDREYPHNYCKELHVAKVLGFRRESIRKKQEPWYKSARICKQGDKGRCANQQLQR